MIPRMGIPNMPSKEAMQSLFDSIPAPKAAMELDDRIKILEEKVLSLTIRLNQEAISRDLQSYQGK